ncbi:MAG: glycerol-3-phosphate 1-O-acyltransferase PlsY [Myxococcales bacterium]|nr:glycerol-3-phosphate 1-O-acyltransferase PlsY [Myxococcales bacterium]
MRGPGGARSVARAVAPWYLARVTLGVILVVCAYLLGSIPFGLLLCRLRGIDLREIGSGNIGATNAARALGKKGGAIVLVLDALKGFVPVLLTAMLTRGDALSARFVGAAMMAAVLGHIFPVFLKFRGGKGVATGLGVTLGASWLAGLAGFAVYIAAYALTRVSSVGSLLGVAAATTTVWLTKQPTEIAIAASVIAGLILARHVDNIKRLLAGKEGKL